MTEPVEQRDGNADVSEQPPALTPASPTRERRLHPAVQIGWVVGRIVNAIFLGAMATFAGASLGQWVPFPAVLLGLLVFVTILLLGLWHARLLFTSWRWALREDDVYAGYGVVWRVTRSIPRVRVQHVDITSGPIDRALGLVHVALHVAGSAGPVLTIPGLAPGEAEALREALLESAKIS
jgi:membrane protein YdbS with pleckstrin-like domain